MYYLVQFYKSLIVFNNLFHKSTGRRKKKTLYGTIVKIFPLQGYEKSIHEEGKVFSFDARDVVYSNQSFDEIKARAMLEIL